MESLTRLVVDSLTRHGFDRPIDPHRLQWSRWFRCESSHSLLVVPSKPGIFALAEDVGGVARVPSPTCVRSEQNSDNAPFDGTAFQRRDPAPHLNAAPTAEPKRMLAVLQFSEDDNMAYVLDRMFTHINPMRSRLHSGNCFVRFVVVEDQQQRRSICAALNQWMRNSAEKATGLPNDFPSSLETNVFTPACVAAGNSPATEITTNPDSGSNKNLHCPHSFPSGF
jgi:hypothetical protein